MKYPCIVESEDTLEVTLSMSGQAVKFRSQSMLSCVTLLLDRESVLGLITQLTELSEVMRLSVHPPSTQK